MAWSVADVQRDRELRRDHKGYDHAMVLSACRVGRIHGGSSVAAARLMVTPRYQRSRTGLHPM